MSVNDYLHIAYELKQAGKGNTAYAIQLLCEDIQDCQRLLKNAKGNVRRNLRKRVDEAYAELDRILGWDKE